MKLLAILLVSLTLLWSAPLLTAQDELAAVMEVLTEGVEVRRVNTTNWITVRVEAIVGVGDEIRTGNSGRARIIYFADGVETDIEPNSRYRINQFSGSESNFVLDVAVLLGETRQRFEQALGVGGVYNINTPGMALSARGTVFAIQVQPNNISAMLVSEGAVEASDSADNAEVPPGFGIRSAPNQPLSDVVPATTFAELYSSLDGCIVSVTTADDVRLNVRLGPAREAARVGTVDAGEISRFMGTIDGGQWYRIPFRGGFGWVLSSTFTLDSNCARLRVFPPDQLEDASLYEFIGDPINFDDLTAPE